MTEHSDSTWSGATEHPDSTWSGASGPEHESDVVLSLQDVGLDLGGRTILDGVDWTVRSGERWVVLGRNGSGKTSLVRIASLYLHPSRGRVEVLGGVLGRVDVRDWRKKIGVASSALANQLRAELVARDVVMTAKNAALEPWWHRYDDDDRRRAERLLARLGATHVALQPFSTLSSGERQRVLLARSLMTDPGLLLYDEPTAGLDLGGREELVASLALLAADDEAPPLILVTHHVDEIPPGFTHALLVGGGGVLAAGPLEEVVTADHLQECFGMELVLERRGRRFLAWSPERHAEITS